MQQPAVDDESECSHFDELIGIGIKLSVESDLHALLELILSKARYLTGADGGTLYLCVDGRLKAEIGQCQTFIDRWGEEDARRRFSSFIIPISPASVAGRVALSGELISIDDVHHIDQSITYSDEFDRANDYHTQSLLTVPMKSPDGETIGVLQLINATESGRLCAFSPQRIHLARALASQAAVSIRNARLTAGLRQAHYDALHTLALAAEWRDRETANHVTRVAHYTALIARAAGWTPHDVDLIFHTSPLHDVGKLGIPDAILRKPGALTPEERLIMEKHTLIGEDILRHDVGELIVMARAIAIGHHEKWDGSGYPLGLKGTDIPPAARVVALADVYDALSCRRCYKEPMPLEKVLGILRDGSGRHFEPLLVEALLAHLPEVLEIGVRFADNPDELDRLDQLRAPVNGGQKLP